MGFLLRGFIWDIPILIFAYVLFWGPSRSPWVLRIHPAAVQPSSSWPTRASWHVRGGLGFRLGGSWVVITGLRSRVTTVITHIRGLITPLVTTHEPPSRVPFKGSIHLSGIL